MQFGSRRNQLLWPFWLVLVAFIVPHPATGAEVLRPVGVLSVTNADRWLNDILYLTRSVGRPEVGGILQMMTGDLLKEVDRTKPAGVYVLLVDDKPRGVGFIPVKDFKALLDKVSSHFHIEAEQLDGSIYRLGTPRPAYLKQANRWVFFSDHAEYLKQVPEDPAKLLDGLDKKYDIALRVNFQNIPKALRDLAVERLTEGIRIGLDPNRPENADVDPELAKQIETTFVSLATQLIQQTAQLTLGLGVDAQAKHLRFDFEVTAVKGSQLAAQFDNLAGTKTSFPGILTSDAAICANAGFKLSPQDIDQMTKLVRLLKNQAVKELQKDPTAPPQLKKILEQFADSVLGTIASGTFDAAAAVQVADGSLKFVAAAQTADGKAVGKTFRDLYELAKSDPNVPEIKFNAETFQKTDLHTFSVPIPENEADTRRVLGNELNVVIGTGTKAVYLAFGNDCIALLKNAISKSSQIGPQPVPAARIRVAIKPLIFFLASVNDKDEHLPAIAKAIKTVNGDDSIVFTIEAIPHGMRCRLEIHDAVLVIAGKINRLERPNP